SDLAQSCDPISCVLSVHPLSLNSRWPAVYPILTQWGCVTLWDASTVSRPTMGRFRSLASYVGTFAPRNDQQSVAWPVAPPEPPLKPRLQPYSGTTPALEPRSVPAPAATAAAMAAEPPRPRLGPAPACRLERPGLSDCNGHGPAGAFVRRPAAPARTCRA